MRAKDCMQAHAKENTNEQQFVPSDLTFRSLKTSFEFIQESGFQVVTVIETTRGLLASNAEGWLTAFDVARGFREPKDDQQNHGRLEGKKSRIGT